VDTAAHRRTRQLAIAGLVLLLAACGGGGGGGNDGVTPPAPPSPPPPPPSSSATPLTLTAANFQGAVRNGFAFTETATVFAVNSALTWHARRATAGVGPITRSCSQGGTEVQTIADRNGSGALDAGDRLTLTFTSCAANNATLSGALHIDIDAITDDGQLEDQVERIEYRITLSNYIINRPGSSTGFSGGMRCEWRRAANSDRFIVEGTRFSVHFNAQEDELRDFAIDYTHDYAAYEYRLQTAGEVRSDSVGGQFTFATDVPLIGRLQTNPVAGAVTFHGAGLNAVRVEEGANGELSGDRAGVPHDFDGDGQFLYAAAGTTTNATIQWSLLLAPQYFAPFRDDVAAPPPFTPGPGDLIVRHVQIAEPSTEAGDMVVDPLRARLYVSVPAHGEIAAMSTVNYLVIDRIPVDRRPVGLALGADAATLYAARHNGGGVAVIDLQAGPPYTVGHIDTALANDSSETHRVVAVGQRLYVVAYPEDVPNATQPSYLAEVNRGDGDVTERLLQAPPFSGSAELAASPDGRFLYVWDAAQQELHKLDLAQPGAPSVAQRHFEGSLTASMTLSPDGAHLALYNGALVRTEDLTPIAQLQPTTHYTYSADGNQLVGLTVNGIVLYDPATRIVQATLITDCPDASDARLLQIDTHRWAVLRVTRGEICVFSLADRHNPP
jgi:DNA-binding beta-propeller fold protein YncE